jgi:hypothetical protein
MSKFFAKSRAIFLKCDDAFQRFHHWKWRYFVIVPALFLAIYLLYLFFCFIPAAYDGLSEGFSTPGKQEAFYILYGVFAGLYILVLFLKGFTHRLHGEDFARFGLYLGIGALLCFGFTLSFNSNSWSHDWNYLGKNDHWYIIHTFFTTGAFPDVSLNNQTYQPRFWHLLMGLFMKFNANFVHVSEEAVLYTQDYAYTISLNEYLLLDMCRILMAFSGALTLLTIYNIYKRLNLKGFLLAAATLLTCLTPTLWYVNFYRNNDGLAFFFEMQALLFALRYLQKHDWLSVIMTALAVGAGMETKLNAGLISLYIGGLFVYLLVRLVKAHDAEKEGGSAKDIRRFILQMVTFAIVVFPLGLGWAVFANIRFNEPFGYVMELPANMSYGMYIDPSYYNPFLRYVAFPSPDLFFSIFNHRWMRKENGLYIDHWGDLDFNCWTAFFKTSFFGEHDLSGSLTPFQSVFVYLTYYSVLLLTLVTIVYSLVRFGRLFLHHRSGFQGHHFLRYTVLALLVIHGFAYVYFCYRYPVGCTQNARYAMPLYLPIHILMAYALRDVPIFLGRKLAKTLPSTPAHD